MPLSKRDILISQIDRCLLSDVVTRTLGADSSALLSLGETGFSTDEFFLLIDAGSSFLLIDSGGGKLKI